MFLLIARNSQNLLHIHLIMNMLRETEMRTRVTFTQCAAANAYNVRRVRGGFCLEHRSLSNGFVAAKCRDRASAGARGEWGSWSWVSSTNLSRHECLVCVACGWGRDSNGDSLCMVYVLRVLSTYTRTCCGSVSRRYVQGCPHSHARRAHVVCAYVWICSITVMRFGCIISRRTCCGSALCGSN